jgi:hypothetical protein
VRERAVATAERNDAASARYGEELQGGRDFP